MAWCPEYSESNPYAPLACKLNPPDVLVSASWDSTLKVWDPSAEIPLRSTHTLPSRIYNLSYTSASSTLLVSMAHRHVWVFSLKSLAAAAEGQTLKPDQQRESALKFLTRSIATMADGKGMFQLSHLC